MSIAQLESTCRLPPARDSSASWYSATLFFVQPWKSYKKSARSHGSAEARTNVDKILLRPADFPALLTEEVSLYRLRTWHSILPLAFTLSLLIVPKHFGFVVADFFRGTCPGMGEGIEATMKPS